MEYHPEHVDGFTESAGIRFAAKADECHHCFQIVCSCAQRRFHVLINNKLTVLARCVACGRQITIYDLACYPAAPKKRGSGEFRKAVDQQGAVYVMYEYGETDEGEQFDRNDITWCQIWIEDDSGKMITLLDDETA